MRRVGSTKLCFVLVACRSCLMAAVLAASGACQPTPHPVAPTPPGPPADARTRVLMLTATAGFRHESIAAATVSMRSLSTADGFAILATEDVSLLSSASLNDYDVVMFALTSGELPLSTEQRSALIEFVRDGGGFIGVHSATDTLYGWPEYGQLIGAYFKDHPWTEQATVVVDSSHAVTAGIESRFSILEEFYTFRDNPRGRVQVLLRLDAASVGADGDYPLAWVNAFGAGRVYYNALGHFPATWTDQRFLRQLSAAIRWTDGG